jgi:hypothetical protein
MMTMCVIARLSACAALIPVNGSSALSNVRQRLGAGNQIGRMHQVDTGPTKLVPVVTVVTQVHRNE